MHKIMDHVAQAYSIFRLCLAMNFIQPTEPHGFSLSTLHGISQGRDSIEVMRGYSVNNQYHPRLEYTQ